MDVADDLIILPAEERHLDAIVKIEADSFSNPWSKKSFAEELANTDIKSSLVAFYTGELAGYIFFSHLFEEGELLDIAVSSEYRNKGIGQALLDRMTDQCKQKKVTRITLEVRASNASARKLYEKNGFTSISVRKNYYSYPFEDGIVMEKHL